MTLTSIIKFNEICKKLDIDIKKEEDNFDKRILIQKIFYFLSKQGINLDVKYNFYKFGPYSSELTDYYYTLMEYNNAEISKIHKIEFDKEEELKIKKIKALFLKWKKDLVFLEFLASFLFIFKDMYIKDKNTEKIKETLKYLKPEIFNEKIYQKVQNELREEGLIE